jgi:glucose/mannose transport system permease protein
LPAAQASRGLSLGILLLTIWYAAHVVGALAFVVFRIIETTGRRGWSLGVTLPLGAQVVILLGLTAFWGLITWGVAHRKEYGRTLALIDNLLMIAVGAGLAVWQLLQDLPSGLVWLAMAAGLGVLLWRFTRLSGLGLTAVAIAAVVVAAGVQTWWGGGGFTEDVLGTLVSLGLGALLAGIGLLLTWFCNLHENDFVIGTRDERIVTITLLAPSLIAIAIFVYAFIAWSGLVSISSWSGIEPDYTLRGLQNYIDLFGNTRFQVDVRNTIFFTVVFIVVCLGVGILLAILLDQRLPGEGLFRSIFLFPMAISFVVTGVVWRWLYIPGTSAADVSGINLLLQRMGLTGFNFRWFLDTTVWPGVTFGSIQWFVPVGMIAIVIAAAWQMSGYTMALYLAGLRGISEEIREAARVDGATEIQIYRHIILPLLQPITLSAMIILGHISLKIFDLVAVMTPDGGQGFITDVPALHMFQIIYKANRYADGAAIAIMMLLMVAALVVPYLRDQARQEVEQ